MESTIWPALPMSAWKDTHDTLHMWMQIAGKVPLKLSPPINHWWHTTFRLSPRGFVTPLIPYGTREFSIEFDLVDHQLRVETCDQQEGFIRLTPKSVADFYFEFMALLESMGLAVKINRIPQEVPDPTPFDQDQRHASYDPEYANRFWRILVQVERVFARYRSGFIGKCSPIQFFWGSFDLALTRFSGRKAPPRPEFSRMMQEAYSHEVMSVGFWPGAGIFENPAFYAYAAPEPPGFSTSQVKPESAFYDPKLREFILRYEDVRTSANPDRMILEFLNSAYERAATLGKWDRANLEPQPLLKAA